MNILLVDDEQLHLEGLSHIIRSHYTSTELKLAQSALQALSILETFPADIILTDIEMPVLSGLDLIQELHRRSVKSKIIIVSAHDKFTYAQKAVELGMVSYLLKPFSPDTIYTAIDKAARLIQEEHDRQEAGLLLQEKLENTIPFYLNHLLNKLSITDPDPGDLSFLHDIFRFSAPFYILFTHFDRPVTDRIYSDFPLYIRQSLNQFGKGLSFFSTEEPNTFCTILQLCGTPDTDTQNEILQFLNELEYDYAGMVFELSQPFLSFPTPFYEAFGKMSALASQHYFNPADRVAVLNPDNLPFYLQEGAPAPPFPADLARQLTDLIREGKKKESTYLIQSLFRPGRQFFSLTKKTFFDFAKKLEEELFDTLLRVHSSQENLRTQKEAAAALTATLSVTQAGKLLSAAVCEIIDRLQSAADVDRLSVMSDCMKYIQEHYKEDLSLETVAAKYYFNPSYFSTLFRACTNQNFSEYLTKIRLEKSAQLLLTTRMKVYEIAAETGYNDCAYFNRVFKKEFGISPEKYRKGKRLHEMDKKDQLSP